jgi:hypothetical protein
MPEAPLTDRSQRGSDKGFGQALSAIFRLFRVLISSVTKRLAAAVGFITVFKFRRDVIKQMVLTVTNLDPEVIIGATDPRGWYTEIYLNFGDFRLRITRAIYNARHRDLWADIGSASDPSAFFRMDYVVTAIRRLDEPDGVIKLSDSSVFPNTLAALDATVWALHQKLAEYLSAVNYDETKRMIQQVMHEEASFAHTD